MCIEPCVVERKNRLIFQNKITFDAFSLNTAKLVWLKKVFNKIITYFRVMYCFINKKLYLSFSFTNANIKYVQFNWISCCTLVPGRAAARLEREGTLRHLLNVKFLHLWIEMTIIIFASKIMHKFQIRFDFAKHFFKSNLYFGCI